jgi:nucleotide-binding universal stress UspA family protein
MFDRIVVGFDGSEGSSGALACAAAEAEMRGATLDVVSAVFVPTVYPVWPYGETPPFDADQARADVAARLDDVVAPIRREHASLEIGTKVLFGAPIEALATESKTADVVVVGTTWRKLLR